MDDFSPGSVSQTGDACASSSASHRTLIPAPRPERAELLAPAGDWDCLRAAVANGADAVYFGLSAFNARMRAENFTVDELPAVVEYLHSRGARAHVTLNTLIFTAELEEACNLLARIERAGADVVLLQDIGLLRLARDVAPDVALHASTQMTVTSPEGARFVARLGASQVVLARELSLQEIERFAGGELPVEVFVHGALCVAYSGQCLTSESFGQRSANRGECAQACRQPYALIVDGRAVDLGDRRFLLSPQDLAAVAEIPALLEAGVRTFKIEGRLKAPEYVAAVTDVYRRAIDAALAAGSAPARGAALSAEDRYRLEMAFSRGLDSGWLQGDDHQRLVHARFGTKRGPFVGRIGSVGRDFVELADAPPAFLRPGDGLVFDTGGDTDREQGGRLYELRGRRLTFENRRIDFRALRVGDRVWKTHDPVLERALRRTFAADPPARRRVIDLVAHGAAGEPLVVEASLDGETFRVESTLSLQRARGRPLDASTLARQLGRLGGTSLELGALECRLEGAVALPRSAINAVRRELVRRIEARLTERRRETEQVRLDAARERPSVREVIDRACAALPRTSEAGGGASSRVPELAVLCRTLRQIGAALESDVGTIYADFEDIRGYAGAVEQARAHGRAAIFLATPRIQKPRERGFFQSIERHTPDGILIRNLGGLEYFHDAALRRIGDYSLNVANPVTASILLGEGLERLTASYDLDAAQLGDLLAAVPRGAIEVTLHQHMPMFHMAHCVFAAFLSNGRDHTDCGRPCDLHELEVRDHVGMAHPVKADVGCRNTVFNARAQSGAAFWRRFAAAGATVFRVELLGEDAAAARRTIALYQRLVAGQITPDELIRQLEARSQLGVTLGTLKVR